MNYDLHTIRAAGKKQVPYGTKVKLCLGTLPGTVHVYLKLPGQSQPSDLGDLSIVDGVIELPVRLLFLSYAREDKLQVKQIADQLLQDGFLTWLDTKDLLPGDNWRARIQDAIERADYVLVFLSRNSANKVGFIQKELRLALDQQDLRPTGKRYIIPIRLEQCEVPPELRDIHWLDYWERGAYNKLKSVLK